MSLAKLRKEIKAINSQVLKLLAKRAKISKKIGLHKKKHKLKITDKKQEKEVFAKLRKQSRKLKLNVKFVDDIFKRIVKESKRLQK
ncbi:chorismate mutase [Candidatus Woesearchaeota archaeon]|nr:chorismate mutase [Candidatus Woesearchaeota archaeon]